MTVDDLRRAHRRQEAIHEITAAIRAVARLYGLPVAPAAHARICGFGRMVEGAALAYAAGGCTLRELQDCCAWWRDAIFAANAAKTTEFVQ